ncbi:unnamed protein product [Phytophthora fragariaefolia]|uniref:Unnamed protein product n=1 Tax=Phytophthora fragariaefolia TaxID=1490495 RepID=A0A9W7CZQ3_9STRA|nr:unnamed protein product [Phytophthora fragariaefolia]
MLTPSDVFEELVRSAPQVPVPPATGATHQVPPAKGPGSTPVSTTSTSDRDRRSCDPTTVRATDAATVSVPICAAVPSVTESISFGAAGAPFALSEVRPLLPCHARRGSVPVLALGLVNDGTGHVIGLADDDTGLVLGARVAATGHASHHVDLAHASRIVATGHTNDPHESCADRQRFVPPD